MTQPQSRFDPWPLWFTTQYVATEPTSSHDNNYMCIRTVCWINLAIWFCATNYISVLRALCMAEKCSHSSYIFLTPKNIMLLYITFSTPCEILWFYKSLPESFKPSILMKWRCHTILCKKRHYNCTRSTVTNKIPNPIWNETKHTRRI